MADRPETNDTTDNAVDPQLALRLDISFVRNLLLMLPVSLYSGLVTGYMVSWACGFVSHMLLWGRHNQFIEAVCIVASHCAGIAAGMLTIVYYLVQLDKNYGAARLRGQLHVRRLTRCPACQGALVVGQVLCDGCGKDLRVVHGFKPKVLRARRLALVSFALASILLTNAVFVIVAVATKYILARIGILRPSPAAELGCALAAAGGVLLLRVTQVVIRWRLLNAEEMESRVEPK